MLEKIKIDILFIGNEDEIYNVIGDHINPMNFSIIHANTINEFSTLCQNYDFGQILVDFNLENYRECYIFAKKAKKVMNEYQITGRLYAISSISVTCEIIVKNDFDNIISIGELNLTNFYHRNFTKAEA